MGHRLFKLDEDWQLISSGGIITEIQNRSSEPFEVISDRTKPGISEKGFILNEQILPRFTNLPVWAKSKTKAIIAVDTIIPSLTELGNAIHAGRGYIITQFGSVPKADNIIFLARTGEDQVHFDRFNLDLGAGNVTLELFKSPTITTLGTPIVPDTLNDISAIPAQTLVYGGTTVSNSGTLKHGTKAIFTGTGTNANVTQASIAYGRVLAPKTDYIIKISNLDVNTPVEYSVTFTFHESAGILE